MGYLPANTVILKLDNKAAMNSIKNLPFVFYSGKYYAAYKLGSKLLEEKSFGDVKIIVLKGHGREIMKRIAKYGYTAHLTSGYRYDYIRARLPYSMVVSIAKSNFVIRIEKYSEYRIMNDVAHAIIQGGSTDSSVHPIWDHGLYGEGEIVGVSDTGIDYDHAMFRDTSPPKFDDPKNYDLNNLPSPDPSHRKIVHYWTYVDDHDLDSSGHGSHVCGSIAGNATPYSSSASVYNGEAPSAKISFVDIGGSGDSLSLPDDLNYLFAWMYHDGARIASNSWGSSSNSYSSNAMQVDEFMWNHPDFLILFANGNSGSSTNTVGEPATAKNCISVGALGYASYFGGSETLNDIASFSSRGPTADGRLKPTIVAPGVAIDSADSDGDPNSYNSGITSMDGTSMATPTAAGGMALVREYIVKGYYPYGIRNTGVSFTPSAALLKAMAINSADQATGDGSASHTYSGMVFPNNDQGFGRLNLDNVLYFPGDSRKLLLWDYGMDTNSGLLSGKYWQTKIYVSDSSQDLKITLVWTDYPASAGANPALVNDFDLIVQSPDGKEYHGNIFTGNSIGSVYSASNPSSYDRLNPEEEVWIHSPAAGVWKIKVVGYSVSVPQSFAVVVTGGIDMGKGGVKFDKLVYGAGYSATITLVDLDATTSTVNVYVSSKNTGDSETVTLSKIGNGVYKGSIQLTSSDVQGKLYVTDGDVITCKYGDVEVSANVKSNAPQISNVQVSPTSTSATITWTTDVATNYTIWYGVGTLNKKVSSTQYTSGQHSATLNDLQPETTYTFKISVWDSSGNKAETSQSTFTTLAVADILLVDDDGGSSYEGYFKEALDANGYGYDVWDVSAQGSPGYSTLSQYKVVIWSTGATYENTLTTDDMNNLKQYLDNGGALFLSSQDLLWEVSGGNDGSISNDFVVNYLGVDAVANDKSYTSVNGVSGDPIGDGLTLSLSPPYTNYADTLGLGNGVAIFTYSGSATATRYANGNFKTVFLAFPFEAVQNANSANGKTLMKRIIEWLRADYTAKADLTVSSISYSPQSPSEGDAVTIYATVKNAGGKDASGFTVKFYLDYVDSQHLIGSVDSVSVSAGGSKTVSVTWDTSGYGGTHTIYVYVDKENYVDEENENNNMDSSQITVQTSTGYGVEISCGNTQATVQPGGEVVYTITVKNTGTAQDTISLQLSGLQGDWSASLAPQSLTLSAGTADTVKLTVKAPSTASDGDKLTLTVTAVSNGDTSKKDSLQVTTIVSSKTILLVDDDGGSSYEGYFKEALDANGYGYDVWDVSAQGSPGYSTLSQYKVVIWSTGATYENTLTTDDMNNLKQYLDNGGALFLSSQDLLWEVSGGNDGSISNDFVVNYLGVDAVANDKSYTSVNGVSGDPIGDGLSLSLNYPYTNYADWIGYTNNAYPILANNNYATAVRYAGSNFRTVFLAFSFEAVVSADASAGADLLKRIVNWLMNGGDEPQYFVEGYVYESYSTPLSWEWVFIVVNGELVGIAMTNSEGYYFAPILVTQGDDVKVYVIHGDIYAENYTEYVGGVEILLNIFLYNSNVPEMTWDLPFITMLLVVFAVILLKKRL